MLELTVDLTQPPERRWMSLNPRLIRELVAAAEEELHKHYPAWLLNTVETVAYGLTAYAPSSYLREIEGYATYAGLDPARLLLLNLSYDFSSCGAAIPGMHGCTGALLRRPSGELLLARNMDWSFPEAIRDMTMVIRYVRGADEALTIGFPGCIGVLTGVNNHGVAVALNQAFVPQFPNWAIAVPWLLRDTLLSARTYQDAFRKITTTRAMSAGFYLITDGATGALVESDGDADVFTTCDNLLVVANHFSHERPDPEMREWGDTFERHQTLRDALKNGLAPKRALQLEPVEHGYTAHQIVLNPQKRSIEVRCPNDQEPTWETFNVR